MTSPSWRGRATAVAFVAVVAVACGKGGSDGAGGSGSGGGPDNGVPTVDGTYVPTAAGQWLLDGSTGSVSDGPNGEQIVHAELPVGSASDTTITLAPSATGLDDPSLAPPPAPDAPIRGFSLAHTLGDAGLTWSMTFTVATSDVPSSALTLRPLDTGGSNGAETVSLSGVLGVIDQAALMRIEQHVSGGDTPVAQSYSALLAISQALEKSAEYQKLEQRIAGLRQCAENPTNPLTQKMYAEDPSAKQRVLSEIDDAESEVRMDMLVRFVGALNAKVVGLAEGAKWLGWVVGPVTSWADKGIAAASEARVDDVAKLVTGCGGGPATWSGTITISWDGQTTVDTGPTGAKNEVNQDHQEAHYSDTITIGALTVNEPGAMAAEHATESFTRHQFHSNTCGDGLTATSTADTKSSGALDDPASANVTMIASGGTFTLVVSGKDFAANGQTDTTAHNPGGSCVGSGSTAPPTTTNDSTPVSWTVPGATFTSTGDLDPKNPPAELSGSQPIQGQSPEAVPYTGTVKWSLHRAQ